MKMLSQFLFALCLVFSAATYAAGVDVEIKLASGDAITQRYAAKGKLLAVMLTGEYGWNQYEYQAGEYLAKQGIETWVADFFSGYFLSPGMSSARKIPDTDLIAWLEQVQKQSGKREIVFIAAGHMAQPILRLAELWRAKHGKLATIRGAVFLFPLLYDDIEPGQEPVYDPVVQRSRLNIAFLQPQAAAGYWWRERLKAALESAGSQVKLTVLAGLRDGYYRRPDASPEELVAGDKLGELLLTHIKALPKGNVK